jgi:hypothetical protein
MTARGWRGEPPRESLRPGDLTVVPAIAGPPADPSCRGAGDAGGESPVRARGGLPPASPWPRDAPPQDGPRCSGQSGVRLGGGGTTIRASLRVGGSAPSGTRARGAWRLRLGIPRIRWACVLVTRNAWAVNGRFAPSHHKIARPEIPGRPRTTASTSPSRLPESRHAFLVGQAGDDQIRRGKVGGQRDVVNVAHPHEGLDIRIVGLGRQQVQEEARRTVATTRNRCSVLRL